MNVNPIIMRQLGESSIQRKTSKRTSQITNPGENTDNKKDVGKGSETKYKRMHTKCGRLSVLDKFEPTWNCLLHPRVKSHVDVWDVTRCTVGVCSTLCSTFSFIDMVTHPCNKNRMPWKRNRKYL